ncbi:hypothetical protein JCM1840_006847 [Sporobolomyces johnsonii]
MAPRKKHKKDWQPLNFDPYAKCRSKAGQAGACAVTYYEKKQHAKADRERGDTAEAQRQVEAAAQAAWVGGAGAPQEADGGVFQGVGHPWREVPAEGGEWAEVGRGYDSQQSGGEDEVVGGNADEAAAQAEQEALEAEEEEREREAEEMADALQFESEQAKAEQHGFSDDSLKLFKLACLRVQTSMTRRDFERLLKLYPDIAPADVSEYRLWRVLDSLSGAKYRRYWYFDLASLLRAHHRDKAFASASRYRSRFTHSADELRDVFDGARYQSLLHRHVVVDGKEQAHKFFDSPLNVALGILLDGFTLFDKGKSSCWPIIAINYNLPPSERYKMVNILPIMLIPGKPKNLDSFLLLFVEDSKSDRGPRCGD